MRNRRIAQLVFLINDDYSENGLLKTPIDNPDNASTVNISGGGFAELDSMIILDSTMIIEQGNVVGVTNDGVNPEGNVLMELTSVDNGNSVTVVNIKYIVTNTTVAVLPPDNYYVINQDFQNNFAEN